MASLIMVLLILLFGIYFAKGFLKGYPEFIFSILKRIVIFHFKVLFFLFKPFFPQLRDSMKVDKDLWK